MAPLDGIRVVEFGGIGPNPFAGMILANLGATVIRLQRPGEQDPLPIPGAGAERAGRPALALNLKDPRDRDLALALTESADALIEGFRPGVMERFGLGPEELHERNPQLVYGRITGYGQHGPLAQVPGHDINYVAVSGVLSAIARRGERPLFPLNLLGDYGGGAMVLVVGVVSALLEAQRTGKGKVVDAAMVDGVAQLATAIFSFAQAGAWGEAGTNVLDSGAHFYEVYETADGGHIAVGAIEPQFYVELLRILDIDPVDAPQWEPDRWPELKQRFAEAFRTRTRAEWAELVEKADACATPVLSLSEAAEHPHNVARATFAKRDDGNVLPAVAPRIGSTGTHRTQTAADALKRWGMTSGEFVEELLSRSV